MSTKEDKALRAAIKFEIKARKLVVKRVKTIERQSTIAASKKAAERKRRAEKLSEYKDYNDAHDAYGWGIITEEEFNDITERLEARDKVVEENRSPEEYAADIIREWLCYLKKEILFLEWELLSDAEKNRIREQNEELRARRKERMEGHGDA